MHEAARGEVAPTSTNKLRVFSEVPRTGRSILDMDFQPVSSSVPFLLLLFMHMNVPYLHKRMS